jgi:hypothetical protein
MRRNLKLFVRPFGCKRFEVLSLTPPATNGGANGGRRDTVRRPSDDFGHPFGQELAPARVLSTLVREATRVWLPSVCAGKRVFSVGRGWLRPGRIELLGLFGSFFSKLA